MIINAMDTLTPFFASMFPQFFLDGKLTPGPMLLNGTVQGRIQFPVKTWYSTTEDGKKKLSTKLAMRLVGLVGKVGLVTNNHQSILHLLTGKISTFLGAAFFQANSFTI